ncbi:hypothetical protein JMJ58_16855 [Haloterrigena salifodinae]|uniref:Polysaccharide lyase n=2 Tax=Haloterrigena salifodinae TaxID=2675099 RepID=A0A8T8E785_9EURY|nr:hypothetical protein JMJ58_16855 [Haloterrigena salifodinae]
MAADSAAAQTEASYDEVIHLDYNDYDSWDDIYRMSNGNPDNLTLVPSPRASGESALQLRAREGGHWGLSTHYDFDGLHEINGRVHFALDSGWEMNRGDSCRLWNCAIARGDSNAGGDGPPDGSDEAGWSNRMYVSSKGIEDSGPYKLESYTYHMDQKKRWGDEIHTEMQLIEPGRWYEFEYYVRVNTIENGEALSDGVVRYWLDGEQVHEWTGLRFRNDPDNLIDTTGPVMHYGGYETAPKNLYAYYDEHSMALNGTFDAAE